MTKMTRKQKDERRTNACNNLRMFLQSMVIVAVKAQDEIGNLDQISDHLDLIESNLTHARQCVEILWNYNLEPIWFIRRRSDNKLIASYPSFDAIPDHYVDADETYSILKG